MISASTEVVTVEERIKLLQDEIALLHNQVHLHHHLRPVECASLKSFECCAQVLYERHRRETLGLRNRRLLSKTKTARIFEEDNRAKVPSPCFKASNSGEKPCAL